MGRTAEPEVRGGTHFPGIYTLSILNIGHSSNVVVPTPHRCIHEAVNRREARGFVPIPGVRMDILTLSALLVCGSPTKCRR